MKFPTFPVIAAGVLLLSTIAMADRVDYFVSRAHNAMPAALPAALRKRAGDLPRACSCIDESGDSYGGITHPDIAAICQTPYGCCAVTDNETDKRASVSTPSSRRAA